MILHTSRRESHASTRSYFIASYSYKVNMRTVTPPGQDGGSHQAETRGELSQPPIECPICFENFTWENQANSPQLRREGCRHWACDTCWTRVMEHTTWKCPFCRQNLRDWLSDEYSYMPPADAIGFRELRTFVAAAMQIFARDTALTQDSRQADELVSLGARILTHLPDA